MNDFSELGRFKIVRQLGRGGMATVYLATDPNGARVVLKVPLREFASDANFLRGLHDEKESLCRLNHPCIVVFKEFLEDHDPPMLVLEYVEGHSLDVHLNETPGAWPAIRACEILSQIAEALAYCHKAGIIHRDVKPSNILLTGNDHVKVADFGIAKLKGMATRTSEDIIRGSALVMAPEQWDKLRLSTKVDIYALGVVAYRMFTGRYPFEGDVLELARAHREQTPTPPRTLNPDLPPPLSDMVLECLNKNPAMRLSSADEFVQRVRKIKPTLDLYQRYRIETEIGRGAMGVVFRATRREDGMTVAIKTLDQRLSDPMLLRRLKQEASLLARLNHSYICQLIEARDNFLVMQYIHGETLSEHIRKSGGLPMAEALAYFRDILQAVAKAHQEHVIHRDLKPSNIMVRDDPIERHAVVMDFGIAKLMGSSALTRTAEGLGAAPYKAPELWRQEKPDARSDIYALGIILYEMLTNRLPFSGGDVGDFKHQHAKVPPASLPRHLDNEQPGIDRFIARCLSKSPRQRFASVAEMYRELKRLTQPSIEPPTEVYPPTPRTPKRPAHRRHSPWTFVIPGLFFVALVALAARFWPSLTSMWGNNTHSPTTTQNPHLSVQDHWVLAPGDTVRFPILVNGTRNVQLGAEPDRSMRFQRVSDGQYECEFVAYANCPDTHRVMIWVDDNGARDSQRVEFVLSSPYSVPKIDVPSRLETRRDRGLTIPVRVDLPHAQDTILRVWYHPTSGLSASQSDRDNYTLVFRPSAAFGSSHRVTVGVETRGGLDSATITIAITEPPADEKPQGRRIRLSLVPPSHVLIGNRKITSSPIGHLDTIVAEQVREIAIMHPDYPIRKLAVPIDGIRQSVNLGNDYAKEDNIVLIYNVIGLDDNATATLLINGVPRCNPRERCTLIAGEYECRLRTGTGNTLDSLQFNYENVGDRETRFRLNARESNRPHTFVFFVH